MSGVGLANGIALKTNLDVNGQTLEPSGLAFTFTFTDFNLFNYKTPKIPLFSYGIPGVVSLDIDLQFSLNINLTAAVTLVLDTSILDNPLNPAIPFAFQAPTFIRIDGTIGA